VNAGWVPIPINLIPIHTLVCISDGILIASFACYWDVVVGTAEADTLSYRFQETDLSTGNSIWVQVNFHHNQCGLQRMSDDKVIEVVTSYHHIEWIQVGL